MSDFWDANGGNIVSTAVNAGSGIISSLINNSWQSKENEIARQREDTAVQRRAADLEAAGLSKTLAAGSAADSSNMSAAKFSMSPEMKLYNKTEIEAMKKQNEIYDAQKRLYDSQNQGQIADNMYKFALARNANNFIDAQIKQMSTSSQQREQDMTYKPWEFGLSIGKDVLDNAVNIGRSYLVYKAMKDKNDNNKPQGGSTIKTYDNSTNIGSILSSVKNNSAYKMLKFLPLASPVTGGYIPIAGL